MNKTLLASGLVSALGLLGCTTDDPTLGTNQGMSFEEFKAQAAREIGTGFYVVDGDRVVSSDDQLFQIWSDMQQGALAIYTVGTGGADIKWTPAQQVNITYCIGATFNAVNKQKIIDGMTVATTNGWETFANVNFVHLTAQDGAGCTAANTAVMFDINQVTGQPYLARAFFPNNPRAERNVLVDTTALDPATSGYPLANILGHELGHTLGFRHEHVRPEAQNPAATACNEGTEFRGIGAYDKLSVMHYPQCNGDQTSTLAFTLLDKAGVAAIYGAVGANARPISNISSPSEGANVPQNFQVVAQVMDNDLQKAELVIDGTLSTTLTGAPFEFQVTNLALGGHTLEVVGTDVGGQTGTMLVNVTVTGGGNGNGDGDGNGNDITGGCNAGGSGGGLLLGFGLLGLVGLIRRRR
ncbi:MAG: M57 family metalloprotease [Kofleriaceae bacterium]